MSGRSRYAGYGENLFTFGAGAVGVSAYALCLGLAFTPAAIGVAGLYSLFKTSLGFTRLARQSSRQKYFQKMETNGYLYCIPEYHSLYDTVNELAGKLDLKTTPSVYARAKVPYKSYAASSIGSFIFVPEEEKRQGWSDEEQRFIIAHELSHLKTDDSKSFNTLGSMVSKYMTGGLFWGSITIGLAGTVIGGVPTVFATGYGAVSGLATLGLGVAAQKLCFNAAKRVQEFRADRNALSVTQDGEAALQVIDKLNDPDKTGTATYSFSLKDIFGSHPSYQRRVSALREAWDGMESPRRDNDNTTPISAQAPQQSGAKMHRSPC